MQYNTQPLVAALPAVVGAHPTRTAERLSELISQSQSMSVHHSMSVNISHPGAAIAERSGRNETTVKVLVHRCNFNNTEEGVVWLW